jgi:hypothetical protein
MARCPRCLKPVDEERNCLDSQCSYRMRRDSLRPLWMIFVLVGLVHLALVRRFGIPAVEHPVPTGFWLFVAVCWLFVNGAATILLYVPYVFVFELHPDGYAAWLAGAKRTVHAAIWSGSGRLPRGSH